MEKDKLRRGAVADPTTTHAFTRPRSSITSRVNFHSSFLEKESEWGKKSHA